MISYQCLLGIRDAEGTKFELRVIEAIKYWESIPQYREIIKGTIDEGKPYGIEAVRELSSVIVLALSYFGAWSCALLLLGSSYGAIMAIIHGLIMILTFNFYHLRPFFKTDS